MRINTPFKFVISVGVSQLAGVIGSIFTVSAISSWYNTLNKPQLAPPNSVFGPVWTTLFLLMGIGAFLIWRKYDTLTLSETADRAVQYKRQTKIALGIFLFQLVLNTLWSIIFFGSTSLTINGLNNIGIAFVEIVILWLAIIATIISFAKISKPAAWLMLPYLLWVSFAGYLNFMIWRLN
jgi:tryptophan-rich sensory protein